MFVPSSFTIPFGKCSFHGIKGKDFITYKSEKQSKAEPQNAQSDSTVRKIYVLCQKIVGFDCFDSFLACSATAILEHGI